MNESHVSSQKLDLNSCPIHDKYSEQKSQEGLGGFLLGQMLKKSIMVYEPKSKKFIGLLGNIKLNTTKIPDVLKTIRGKSIVSYSYCSNGRQVVIFFKSNKNNKKVLAYLEYDLNDKKQVITSITFKYNSILFLSRKLTLDISYLSDFDKTPGSGTKSKQENAVLTSNKENIESFIQKYMNTTPEKAGIEFINKSSFKIS